MRVGTKSLLFGYHCFWLHPLIVALSWVKLYDFRRITCPHTGVRTSIFDWRLWAMFFVHDIGYWGKPNMDGPEGESHPYVGARIIRKLTGKWNWYDFSLYHSRFLARKDNHEPSLFCWADKLAISLSANRVFLFFMWLTGELHEYMNKPREIKGNGRAAWAWWQECGVYCKGIAYEHKDGRTDTWTPKAHYAAEPDFNRRNEEYALENRLRKLGVKVK